MASVTSLFLENRASFFGHHFFLSHIVIEQMLTHLSTFIVLAFNFEMHILYLEYFHSYAALYWHSDISEKQHFLLSYYILVVDKNDK